MAQKKPESKSWALLALPIALLALVLGGALEPSLAHGIGGKDAAFVAATK